MTDEEREGERVRGGEALNVARREGVSARLCFVVEVVVGKGSEKAVG